METDFNKPGQIYDWCAVAPARFDFGALKDGACDYLEQLRKHILEGLSTQDPRKAGLAAGAHACLQCLAAVLFQSTRFAHYATELQKAVPPPGYLQGLSMSEACIDFASLLFHSRAALDRLTLFVAGEVHGQRNADRFSKLQNILANFRLKDQRAVAASEILQCQLASLQGLILDTERRSLRSALIHRSSFGEITVTSFTVQRLADGRIFRFDFELQSYPLIGSAQTLSRSVTFIVLNLLALYTGFPNQLSLTDCDVRWDNPAIHFSDFIDVSKAGPRFSVIKMLPDGFELVTRHLRPDVLKLAQCAVAYQEADSGSFL